MAHIQIRTQAGGGTQLVINGVDYSMETYRGFEIVEVGDDPMYAEVGFRVTFVVSQLDLDAEADVAVTDHVHSVAARVHSMDVEVA